MNLEKSYEVNEEKEALIDEIQRIRGQNNRVWMDLVRLAFRMAPDQAGEIFKKITYNDRIISDLTRRLADDS